MVAVIALLKTEAYFFQR